MKTEIEQVDYDNNLDINGNWWSWLEICDKCGSLIRNKSTISSASPKTDEVDFCCECLRYLIDNRISYEDAKLNYVDKKIRKEDKFANNVRNV